MDIEFVAAGAAVSAKTAVARVVFEGDAYTGHLADAVAASRFTGAKGQALDILARVPDHVTVGVVGLKTAGRRTNPNCGIVAIHRKGGP